MMKTNNDIVLYGALRKPSVIHHLHAGPVSVKFQDGELRYLYVGEKEIIRRVYFGVRDSRWDTVMPELSNIDVQQDDTSFDISFDAVCTNDEADYGWHGEIHGNADGTIIFTVDGTPNADFDSPRIGINILYGSGSLAGQAFWLLDGAGTATTGIFPVDVSDNLLADCNSFRTLRYTTEDGMTVSAGLDTICIGMEDQRNYGDSSYKAFSSMSYRYPCVRQGKERSQVFIMQVENVPCEAIPIGRIQAAIGELIPGAKMPNIISSGPLSGDDFQTYNHEPLKYADTDLFIMPYNPAAHMPDDDTFMENIPTILDWVRTIRAFAPDARFRFDPIDIDSPYPRAGKDPRNYGLFAASWCARVVKYLALGGVDEGAFALDTGYAASMLRRFIPFAGHPILKVDVSPGTPSPIDMMAVDEDNGIIIWLMNLTDQPQQISLCGLHNVMLRYSASSDEEPNSTLDPTTIALTPFEVLELSAQR
ncbi:MAG: hypothetical protein ACYC0V_18430 [Armatimonadota bacterium]